LNIAFVSTESPYDDHSCGIGSYLRAIIPALVETGNRVIVFSNASRESVFRTEKGRVTVHHFRLPALHWYSTKVPGLKKLVPLPLRQLEWSRAFYRRVRDFSNQTKIDVIEGVEAGSMFLNRIAPLVIRLHGSESIFRRHAGIRTDLSVRCNEALESVGCNRAAALTTPSKFQALEICKYRGWQTERVRVIPNPISGEMLRAARQFHRNGHSQRVVLYVGRLAPVKGIETLLEAARLVHSQDPALMFVLAGPWQMPQPPAAYGLSLNEKSADGICWIGPQKQSALIDLYKQAALFVMPSFYESFGISAAEAMAFDLPIVATDAGALPEVFADTPTTFVAKGDPGALAAEIIRTMSRRGDHRQTRKQVEELFAPARVAADTLALYQEIVRN